MEKGSFSIVIPVHNEELILASSVHRLNLELKSLEQQDFEIIIVENGSTDDTYKIATNLTRRYSRIRLITLRNPSFGQAIKQGMLYSTKECVFIFNIDFWDMNFLTESLKLLADVDIVIGSKRLASSQDSRSHFRRLITYLLNYVLKTLLRFPGTDTHGIKGLKRKKLLPLIQECVTQHELFDTELLLKSYKCGFTMAELPVSVKEIRPTRHNYLRRVKNVIIDVLLILRQKYSQHK